MPRGGNVSLLSLLSFGFGSAFKPDQRASAPVCPNEIVNWGQGQMGLQNLLCGSISRRAPLLVAGLSKRSQEKQFQCGI